MKILKALVLLATVIISCLFSTPLVHAVEVSAATDRKEIYLDESVKLILTAEGEMTSVEPPDLMPLQQDFEILGQSTQTNINIINNTSHVTQSWIIEIQPKQLGTLQIPILSVAGEWTQPLELEVREFKGNVTVSGSEIFLEVEVSSDTPYVQSQVNFTTRLFYSVPVLNGRLSDPNLPFGTVEGAAQDKRYSSKRGGKEYRVIERRYAFFPERSGSFSVPPIEFTCLIERRDPVTGLITHISERYSSKSIDIEVKPIPRSYTGSTWLPAQDLKLIDSWSGRTPKLELGKPQSRTISVDAVGLRAVQIPLVSFQENSTARIYGGSNAELETLQTYDWTVARRTDEFALIPQSDTTVEVPEFRLVWWDVNEDREKVSVLPAISVRIGQPFHQQVISDSGEELAPVKLESVDPAVSEVQENLQWRLISLALLVIWVLTLIAWCLNTRFKQVKSPDSDTLQNQLIETESRLRRDIRSACLKGDIGSASQGFLNWAQIYWRNSPPRNLLELGRRLMDEDFTQELNVLDRIKYSGEGSSWNGQRAWRSFRRAVSAVSGQEKKRNRFSWFRSHHESIEELWPGQDSPT